MIFSSQFEEVQSTEGEVAHHMGPTEEVQSMEGEVASQSRGAHRTGAVHGR